jgi:methyltransferase (TIGR00027 family)
VVRVFCPFNVIPNLVVDRSVGESGGVQNGLMRPGTESQTAVMVAMGRAVAHAAPPVPGFDDPTALGLLPADARGRVERFRAGDVPVGLRGRLQQRHLTSLAQVMAVRTVAVDEAIREASQSQLVLLGAGLDGRAWRMHELHDVIVFEVDHPDSQRAKASRVATLTQHAREVKFVPVDFTRDSLDKALDSAGHDSAQPTTWVWEGVVMYLTRDEIERTMATVATRSAPASRLIVVYHSPAVLLHLVRLWVRRVGEPLRSVFRPARMRSLLATYGFTVTSDQDLPTMAGDISAELAHAIRWSHHLRVAVADRLV